MSTPVPIANIKGPKGDKGDKGDPGPQVHVGPDPPQNPEVGQLWWDTS